LSWNWAGLSVTLPEDAETVANRELDRAAIFVAATTPWIVEAIIWSARYRRRKWWLVFETDRMLSLSAELDYRFVMADMDTAMFNIILVPGIFLMGEKMGDGWCDGLSQTFDSCAGTQRSQKIAKKAWMTNVMGIFNTDLF
jgi:hypothetical protein